MTKETLLRLEYEADARAVQTAQIMAMYLDFTEIPRAFAHGPAEKRELVIELATKNLDSYVKHRRQIGDVPEMCDRERYTLRVTMLGSVLVKCSRCGFEADADNVDCVCPYCGRPWELYEEVGDDIS